MHNLLALIVFGASCLHFVASSTAESNLHFATKTAYRHRRQLNGDWAEDEQFLSRCTPIHVIALRRHGTRLPALKSVRKIERLHARLTVSHSGQGYLPSELSGWKSPFPMSALITDKPLSEVGWKEMRDQGHRFRQRYENRVKLMPENFYIGFTSLPRARQSAEAFVDGLNLPMDRMENSENNRLLRFFSNCKRYQLGVRKNASALHEYHRFKAGPEVAAVVKAVKERFQLFDIDFGPGDIELVYSMCGLEIANNVSSPTKSPWCQLFRPSEVEVLEYLQDIRQYWKMSSPYEISIKMSCPLVAEFLDQMHAAQSFTDRPTTFSLYFAHAETLVPILTQMRFFQQEEHLRADNFASIHANRAFRTAVLSPLGANMALELFRCPTTDPNDRGYFVRPLLNEAPFIWPLCQRSFCPYKEVAKHFEKCTPGRFDFQAACTLPPPVGDQSKEDPRVTKDEL